MGMQKVETDQVTPTPANHRPIPALRKLMSGKMEDVVPVVVLLSATLLLIVGGFVGVLLSLVAAFYSSAAWGFLVFWLYVCGGLGLMTVMYRPWYSPPSRPRKFVDSRMDGEIPAWLWKYLESNDRLSARMHLSIEKLHPAPVVCHQVLRLEDLLLDMYVWPWFRRLSTPASVQHCRNRIPLYSQLPLSPNARGDDRSRFRSPANSQDLICQRDSQFIFALRFHLRSILLALKERIEKVDWTTFILEVFVPLLTQHIHDYKRALQEISQKGNRNLTASEELDLYTASLFRQGRLHPALGNQSAPFVRRRGSTKQNVNSSGLPINTVEFETDFLRSLLDELIPVLMPKDQDLTLVLSLLREILSVFVLQPVLSLLAEPDFWNQKIDAMASRAIKEQKMVNKLREALDKPFNENPSKSRTFAKAPSFDQYLFMIKGCRNLIDAKRIHHSILTEVHRTTTIIGGKEDIQIVNGRRVVDLKKYVGRLRIAQKKIEKKIVDLGGTISTGSDSRPGTIERSSTPSGPSPIVSPAVDYGDVVNLLREPALSYFREYLEKIDELDVLQLYCSVEALNQQLAEKSGRASPIGSSIINFVDFDGKKMLRADIIAIYTSYLMNPHRGASIVKKLDLSLEDVLTLFSHIESAKIASEETISAALEYLKACQLKARNFLQVFALSFQQSDLYYRFLSDPARFLVKAPVSPKNRSSLLMNLFRSSSMDVSNDAQSSRSSTPVNNASLPKAAPHAVEPGLKVVEPKPKITIPNLPIIITDTSLDASNQLFVAETPVAGLPPEMNMALNAHSDTDDGESLFNVERMKKEFESIIDEEGDDAQIDDMDGIYLSEEESDHSPNRDQLDSDEEVSDTELQSDSSETKAPSSVVTSSATVDSPTSGPDVLTNQYREEIGRIDADLGKIRQQKMLLQHMHPDDASTKNRERKLLRKMRFQFEQEEKVLENERRQVQWKIDGTFILPNTRITVPSYELVEPSLSKADSSKPAPLRYLSLTSPPESLRPFVVYFVEIVQPQSSSTALTPQQSGWMMARRYSEFHVLHRQLKLAFPELMSKPKFNFPGKRYLTPARVRSALFAPSNGPHDDVSSSLAGTKDMDFIEHRRMALENYLKAIVSEPEVAHSWIFRQFLCEDRLYSIGTNFKGLRDMLPKKASVIGVLSGISQKFRSEDRHMESTDTSVTDTATLIRPEIEGAIHDLDSPSHSDIEQEIFAISQHKGAESLSSLLLELFDLNERSNWWRRHAITWVMQQFLGGTFERRIADFLNEAMNEENLSFYLSSLNDLLESWKDNTVWVPRTQTQKTQARLSVYKKLHLLIPDVAGSIVGKGNAKRGSDRLFDLLQNRRLNQDLIYRSLDLIMKKHLLQ